MIGLLLLCGLCLAQESRPKLTMPINAYSDYEPDAEFGGEFIPLIAESWSKHRLVGGNKKSVPADFEICIDTEGEIRRVHFTPKRVEGEVSLGNRNSRGTEAVYIFNRKTNRFLGIVTSG